MAQATLRIGPADHGRLMTLAEFDPIQVEEGHLYELSRGRIQVTEVPNPGHARQVHAIRKQLAAYDLTNPGRIYLLAGSGECKIPINATESERHPDVAVYKKSAPTGRNPWARWVPEIVIEVVSPDSGARDYEEKREDYWQFGIHEYWIFDADRREMLVLQRSKQAWVEKIVKPGKLYRTRLLPRRAFACGPVFDAAEQA
jgi:Uma2 family endonuclease